MKKLLQKLRPFRSKKPVITVLRLAGVIGGESRFSQSLNHKALAKQIDAAFAPKKLTAVALEINSPGGSPAQSAMIAAHIRRKAAEKSVPVFAFCEDVAASGGYMLACSADEIFADSYAIVGSIGVVSAGFGFPQAMEKLGVERRLYTAGTNKRLIDPFSDEDAEGVTRLKAIQAQIHAQFIESVQTRRENKLKTESEPLFEGDVWLAPKAVELGLIDGIGHLTPILKERFGNKVEFKRVSAPKKGLLARLSMAQAIQHSISGALCDASKQGVTEAFVHLEKEQIWQGFKHQ